MGVSASYGHISSYYRFVFIVVGGGVVGDR